LEPFQINLPQVVARLGSPSLARDFSAIGLSMRGIIKLMTAARPDQLDAYLGQVDSLNRDDRPILEFNTARNLFDVAKRK
jgi:hypothetical protein